MSRLQAGLVTFLFSDIEGSTRLVKALRERYPQVLAEHRRLIRAAIATHGGREVDTQGDAFFAVFGGAKQAVLCALEVQRALAVHDWPDCGQVRVRIGVHTGQAVRAGDGYTGLAVHRAARICAAARGGQVLISQATQAIIEDEEEGDLGFALVDVGEYRLKDLDRPVRLFQLAAPGLDPLAPAGGQLVPGLPQGPVAVSPLRDAGPVAVGEAAAGLHGWSAALTSFVGRDGPVGEVAGLLEEYRLVTVTGPGGVGKTRLAGEVARRVAGRFADGVWLVELAAITDPARVPSAVAAALGIPERPGMPLAEVLAEVLAGWQMLLVLDNCEHVIAAVAGLCGTVLLAADDVRILATSRELAGVPGEARYRLAPLGLPETGQLTVGGSEAEALFAERARRVDPHFTLSGEAGSLVAQLVRRLDGMPLAIELAAARVEALGLVQLLGRLDDRFGMLATGDRGSAVRHRSLAATVEWSYQLLNGEEQRVFRRVSVFPAPFTLEGAEAVAGAAAGPVVVRLVECSLLAPPRAGADGRARYLMMDTIRGYASGRLADAGEEAAASAALAGHALQVAEQCAAGMQTRAGEPAAVRWLDAEDATIHHALAWALPHGPDIALRMAIALAPWWLMRGRLADGKMPLRAAATYAERGSDAWCTVQFWLGQAADSCGDLANAIGYFTTICDALADRGIRPVVVDALAGRSFALANTNRITEGIQDARRAVTLARQIGHPAGEALALRALVMGAYLEDDLAEAVTLTRQAEQIDTAGLPGGIARRSSAPMVLALIAAGDIAAARQRCADTLVLARDTADLVSQAYFVCYMGHMDLLEGRIPEGWKRLRESIEIASRIGERLAISNCEDLAGQLCAATRRWTEAVTLWAAYDVHCRSGGWIDPLYDANLRQAPLQKARQALGPIRTQAAEKRGAAMTMAAVTELAILLSTAEPQAPAKQSLLSPRERDLVSLVAQGRTNAQIAAQLCISVRTVGSHLDRIRDKTGCRRRADLTRLALTSGLI